MSCTTCAIDASLAGAPPRETVLVEEGWRAAHAFGVSLQGWLVLVPRRHVERLDELTDAETARLGPLLAELTGALRAITGCVKTYVALFAEAEGFAHVHFHVVPRMPGFTPEQCGPRVFEFMVGSSSDAVPDDEMDRISLALARSLAENRA